MLSFRLHPIFLAALAVFSASGLRADLKLADIFTDGAVLQRDHEVPVWGSATPGATVSVSFAGKTASATADDSGRWQAHLPAMKASSSSATLTVTSSATNDTTVELRDLLVGEVWLCSGQSNMAMTVARAADADKEIAAAADFHDLRVFTVTRKASQQPLDQCAGSWVKSTPDSAGKFSATAFYFGREIHREQDVPVGLIVAAWSGSAIEAWTSRDVQKEQPYLQPLLNSWAEKSSTHSDEIAAAELAKYEAGISEWISARNAAAKSGDPIPKKPRRPIDPRHHHHHPAVLYNGMISPIIPYAIRGAIWYQGETNGLTAESAALYNRQLPLLINDWRQRWQQGDFAFGCMQLPGVRAQQVDWPPVREAARLMQQNLPNTGFAVTLDLSDASLLHPPNKQDFAHRLALWARAEVYDEDIPGSGPIPVTHRFEKDSAEVDFSNAEKALVAKDLNGIGSFELRASDGEWHPAKATIKGHSIIARADAVAKPIAIRYAWANKPDANLFNDAGLPATPFQLGDTSADITPHAAAAAPPVAKRSTTPPPTDPPLDPVDITALPDGSEQLDIFLLMGQSNMKGRGVMPKQPLRDPRIVMMHRRSDEWFLARHPLHLVGDPQTFERHDNAGVGPGLTFAETVLRHRPETRVALIPCAVGGTRIAKWQKGARLYEETLRRARLALDAGPEGKTRIAGALWLQGEADAQEERLPVYAGALADMIKNLRSDLGIDDLPFLVTTIGEMREDIELRKKINLILVNLPNQVAHTAVADARDLNGHIGDLVHYDTATQNEIGRRFARAWLKMLTTRGAK